MWISILGTKGEGEGAFDYPKPFQTTKIIKLRAPRAPFPLLPKKNILPYQFYLTSPLGIHCKRICSGQKFQNTPKRNQKSFKNRVWLENFQPIRDTNEYKLMNTFIYEHNWIVNTLLLFKSFNTPKDTKLPIFRDMMSITDTLTMEPLPLGLSPINYLMA